MVAEVGCQLRLLAWALAGTASKTALCVLCASTISSGTRSALSSNVSHGRQGFTHGRGRTRIGQLVRNIVTSRTARMDAEQHAQTLTAELQTLTRNPTTQTQAQPGINDTKVWGKLWKLDAAEKGVWNQWRPVTLSFIGKWDRNLMNAMKNSAASEKFVGPEPDSSSISHFLHVTTATGKVLEVVGNAGEGEGLDASGRCTRCHPPAGGGIQILGLPPPAVFLVLRLVLFETIKRVRHVRGHPSLSFVLREDSCSQVSLVRRQRIPRHFLPAQREA